ncbi:TetR/AcrR family transcriptional regulator [Pseudophaeobacter arcticus]|uniref:TetR/AcrR family transcriptional regulator n=2 Tax=Pseudophaeobacter arcticus TaxID=385492 RepID=UPI0006855941|nr:TetR/AcrR family transcriptional regulator [Pseudophaeobacter arcticus]
MVVLGLSHLIRGLPMSSAQQTQSDLLRAAGRHFAERGYQGTSLALVSAEVGVSKQALLHHFKSKELLYRAILEQLNQELVQLLFAAMEETEEAELQLERVFMALAQFFGEHRSAPALLIGVLTDGPGLAVVADDLRPPVQDFLEPLAALIQATDRWQGAGFAAALSLAIELLGAVCLLPAARSNLSFRFGQNPVDQGAGLAPAHARDLVRSLIRAG